jgi:hypothetical protein
MKVDMLKGIDDAKAAADALAEALSTYNNGLVQAHRSQTRANKREEIDGHCGRERCAKALIAYLNAKGVGWLFDHTTSTADDTLIDTFRTTVARLVPDDREAA